ncbi:MAG TPA: helix-turn-helix transcriptional regulator [Micromonosporaceae bacterium]|nr:helix-turn-helix transcriptional regulator [Micromonosporaceae bacterium]
MRQSILTVNGGTVRALRIALGWNLSTFAAAVGVSEGFMSRIERDLRQPAPEVRLRIARTLGVPLGVITREPWTQLTEDAA